MSHMPSNLPPPKTLGDLQSLLSSSSIVIEQSFRDLHHFSQQPPFKTRPSSYLKFVEYCTGLSEGIEPGGENEQTIQRVYRFVELARTQSSAGSLAKAWQSFPLVSGSKSSALK